MTSLYSRSTSRLAQAWHALLVALSLAFWAAAAQAQSAPDPKAAPNDFVGAVANSTLEALKQDTGVKAGRMSDITRVVDKHVLPYVNLEKTTRLAAGQHWRSASASQRQQLVQAFKGTLLRTYGGAFSHLDSQSSFTMLPFRDDPKANDVVVRSSLSRSNGPAVNLNYRLERTPEGWKIYDVNVEGIWLIQNYRNQFAQEITRNGVDGLIKTLNSQK